MKASKLIKIETGNLKLDGGAMFGVVPKVIWQKIYPADENNLSNWAMRCLLFDNGVHKVLIDTGMGKKQSDKFFSHYFPNGDETIESSLKAAGYSFDDITDVIITHLHFDHCGGAVQLTEDERLVPTFPKAVYHVSREQWNLATNPNRREKASYLTENFLPLAEYGVLNLIESEGELIPGVEILLFHGHTVGQVIPVISSEGKKIAYCGDLFPSTAHIPMPYIMGYDTQPLITLKDKERFFDKAISENIILFFEHDIYNECCSLVKTEKGVKVDKTFTLNEFLKH
jgi:glyoxylase-like metal-dependent hydrolase (beta-lactamase superfamily II)